MNIVTLRKFMFRAGFAMGMFLLVSNNAIGQKENRPSDPSQLIAQENMKNLEINGAVQKAINDSGILRDKIDAKIHSEFTELKAEVRDILDFMKSFIYSIFALLVGLLGVQLYIVDSRVRSEIGVRSEKTINEIKRKFKSQMETALKELRQQLNDTHKEEARKIHNSLDFQRSLVSLSKLRADVDEPSLRHPLSQRAKWEIDKYLKAIKDRPEDSLSALDLEIKGDSFHYLAGPSTPDARMEIEDEAIFSYTKALRMLASDKEKMTLPEDMECKPENYELFRKLANAYAGREKYRNACFLYKKLTEDNKFSDIANLDARVWLSWGDACQSQHKFEKFEEAIDKYKKAMEISREDNRPGSIYWEAVYQKGNACTAIGSYKDTIECYTEIEKEIKKAKVSNPFAFQYFKWFFFSMGDAYRKAGGQENLAKSIVYYNEELGILTIDEDQDSRNNRLGETNYRLGRVCADQGLYEDAIKLYQVADEYDYLSKYNYLNHKSYAALACYGYALRQSDDEEKKKDGLSKLREAIDKASAKWDERNKDFDKDGINDEQKYYLAMCYALSDGDADKAKALKLLQDIVKNPTMKIWVQAANYSDFVTIKNEIKALIKST